MTVVRCGLGLVFLYFGVGKFRGDEWADTMKSMSFFQHLPWPVSVSVAISGALEVATGLCLAIGFWVRAAAIVACGELAMILILLKTIGIFEARDVGLMFAAAAVVLCPVSLTPKAS